MTEPVPQVTPNSVESLSSDPIEIKKQFEQDLGVYGSKDDNPYQMLGLSERHPDVEEIKTRLKHIEATYAENCYQESFQKAQEMKKRLGNALTLSDESDPKHKQTERWIEEIDTRFPDPQKQSEIKKIRDRILDVQDFLLNPKIKRTIDANLYLKNPIEKSESTPDGNISFATSKGTSKLDGEGTPGLKEHCEDTAGFRRTKNGDFFFTSDGISSTNGWLMSEALEQAFHEVPQSFLESLTEESLDSSSVHKIILVILDRTEKYLKSKNQTLDTGATFSFTAIVGNKLVSFELGDSRTFVVPKNEDSPRLSNTPHNVINEKGQAEQNQINGYIVYEHTDNDMKLHVVTPTADLRGSEYADFKSIDDLSSFFIQTNLEDGDIVIKTTDGLLKGDSGTEANLVASLKTKKAEDHVRDFVSKNPGNPTERDDTSVIKYTHRHRVDQPEKIGGQESSEVKTFSDINDLIARSKSLEDIFDIDSQPDNQSKYSLTPNHKWSLKKPLTESELELFEQKITNLFRITPDKVFKEEVQLLTPYSQELLKHFVTKYLSKNSHGQPTQETTLSYKDPITITPDGEKYSTKTIKSNEHQPYLRFSDPLKPNTPIYIVRLVEPNPKVYYNPTYSVFEETKPGKPIKIEPRTILRVGDDFFYINQEGDETIVRKFQAINPEDPKTIYDEKMAEILTIADSFETSAGAFAFLNATLNQLSRRKHWYEKIQEKINQQHDARVLLKSIEQYLDRVWEESTTSRDTQNIVLKKNLPSISLKNLKGEQKTLSDIITKKPPHSNDPSKGAYFPQ